MELKELNFTANKFYQLPVLELEDGITATESILYKYRVNILNSYIIKIFRFILVRKNRFETVQMLNEYKKEINIPELIIADKIVQVDSGLTGIAMPFHRGKNVQTILSSDDVSINTKIKILIQIGDIIKKVSQHYNSLGLALGDVHAGNFIYNRHSIKVTDTDAMKILNNNASKSCYLTLNPNLSEFQDVYPKDDDFNIILSNQTDIMCFIFMILNAISGTKTHLMHIDEYYGYLNYLRFLGLDSELLDSFSRIYSKKENTNPTNHLKKLALLPPKTHICCYRDAS